MKESFKFLLLLQILEENVRGSFASAKTILIIILFLIVGGYHEVYAKGPIKIGFVATLTGMQSDVGVSARDGMLLAIEEINKRGGILGHLIKVTIEDDRGAISRARDIDEELIKQGVVAILGHSTSTLTMGVKPIVDDHPLVMLSPVAASTGFSGSKDHVFSINFSLKEETKRLSRVVREHFMVRKVICVYDADNYVYSQDYLHWFSMFFEKLGGKIIRKVAFKAHDIECVWRAAKKVDTSSSDGVLLISSPLHSAILTQQLRKSSPRALFLYTSWAQNPTFIKHGGRFVEGAIFCVDFDPQCRYSEYLQFSKNYRDRFGRSPDLCSMLGYETVHVFKKALEKAGGDPCKLAKTIPGKYRGLQGDIMIDEFGDSYRRWNILQVKDGRFMKLLGIKDENQ